MASPWAFARLGTKTSGATTAAVNVAYPACNPGDSIFLRTSSGQANNNFTVSDPGFISLRITQANGSVQLWWKIADGTESGNFTVTNDHNYRSFYQTAVFTGGPAKALSAFFLTNQVQSSTTNLATPSLTVPSGFDNALIIELGVKIVNGTSITAQAGFTLLDQDNSTAPDCTAWAYQIQGAATNIAANHFTIGSGDSSASTGCVVAAILPGGPPAGSVALSSDVPSVVGATNSVLSPLTARERIEWAVRHCRRRWGSSIPGGVLVPSWA